MSAAFSRIEAARSTATLRVSDAFKNEDGAFDLPSILVGVVVVGILTAGVLASIFGVIPFAQDKGAQQDLVSVTTAEGTYKAQQTPVSFGGNGDLETAKLLPAGTSNKIGIANSVGGAHWAAVTKSASGQWFKATDVAPDPTAYTPATYTDLYTMAVNEMPAG